MENQKKLCEYCPAIIDEYACDRHGYSELKSFEQYGMCLRCLYKIPNLDEQWSNTAFL